jgi:hypothetical protein
MANSSPLLLLFFHRASPKFLKERSTMWLRLLHDSPKLALHYLISGSLLSHKRHEKKNGTRHGKEQHNSEKPQRKRARRRPKRKTVWDSSNPKNLGKARAKREEDDIFVRSGSHIPSSRKYPRSRNF